MVTVPEKCLVKKLLNVYVTGRAVSGRNEKDSRIFQSNLFETQIHQQHSNNKIKLTKKFIK